MKNRKVLIIGLLLAISIIANGCTQDTTGLVAQVNKQDVTEEEFNEELDLNRSMYNREYGEEFLLEVGPDGQTRERKLKQQILDTLIIEKLIEEDSKEQEINVTQEEVDTALEEIKKTAGSQEEYEELLRTNGMSVEYFQKGIRKNIIMERHYEKYLEEIEIKDEDIEKYFEENKEDLAVVRARHILLNDEEHAKDVLKMLKEGADFEEVALAESLDSNSGAQGGDLGYFVRAKMIKEFSDAAFALEVGEISGLVKTEIGYHIIKLEDKVETLEDFQEQIAMILKQEKYKKYVEELKNKADIKIFLELDKVEESDKIEIEETPEEESETEKEVKE